jgi:cytochrome b6-f complex iron-sulfur subunit
MSAMRSNPSVAGRSRRDFLKLCTSYLLGATGVLAAGGVLRFLNYDTEPPSKRQFNLGARSKYAEGSRTLLKDVPALLVRSKAGFSALSLVCTHLGCAVEERPDGFACPCHGSRYDSQGEVLQGPAARPLRRLRLETDADGNLVLYTD